MPFYRDEMVMITPCEERFRGLEGKEGELFEMIRREPVIMREQGSGSKKCMEAYFERMNIREKELQVVAKLNEQESIKKLVAGGFGISLFQKSGGGGCAGRETSDVFSARIFCGKKLISCM